MRPGRPARLLRLVAVVVGARGQAPVPNFLVEVRSGRDAAAAVATVASAVVSAAAGGGGRGLEFTIAAAEPFDELGRFAGAMRLARALLRPPGGGRNAAHVDVVPLDGPVESLVDGVFVVLDAGACFLGDPGALFDGVLAGAPPAWDGLDCGAAGALLDLLVDAGGDLGGAAAAADALVAAGGPRAALGAAVLSLGDACGVEITAVGDDFACEKYRQCTLKWTSARGAGPLILEVVAWDTSLATTADVVDDGVDTFVVREGGVGDGFIARLGRGGTCAPATRRFAVFAGPRGATTTCVDAATGEEGPCGPGVEACGDAKRRRSEGPRFHLTDRLGCGMNDPAGPFFDAASGVVHVFFQKHVAAPPGGGPVWGHFATKDLRRWAQLPVALWNGPGDDAVFTGSAAVVGGAPRLLAAVVRRGGAVDVATYAPADAGDALLAAWAPRGDGAAGAARDPAAPWRTAAGEWRFVDHDAVEYASADFESWRSLGANGALGPACECPSLFPNPGAGAGDPTHVHKLSCHVDGVSGDWWRLGDVSEPAPGEATGFGPAAGWADAFEWRRVDAGYSYAAKDVRVGDATLLLAWVQVAPRSALSLRQLRFDAAARVLAQYPADGALDRRRLPTLFAAADPGGGERVAKTSPALRQSDVTATFRVPGAPPRGCPCVHPTSTYATVSTRDHRPRFANSARAVDSSKHEPNRRRFEERSRSVGSTQLTV